MIAGVGPVLIRDRGHMGALGRTKAVEGTPCFLHGARSPPRFRYFLTSRAVHLLVHRLNGQGWVLISPPRRYFLMPYKDPEKAKASRARRSPNYAENERAWRLWNLYRLTPADYDRVLAHQNGACACCGYVGLKRLAVDHEHRTGLIRGLLCWSCNYCIGVSKDDAKKLRQMVIYLEQPPAVSALGRRVYGLLGRAKRKKVMVYGGSK